MYDAGDGHGVLESVGALCTSHLYTGPERHARDRVGRGVCDAYMVYHHGFGSSGGPVRQENGLHSINISLHALPLCLAGREEVSDVVLGKEKVSSTAQCPGAGWEETNKVRHGAVPLKLVARKLPRLGSRVGVGDALGASKDGSVEGEGSVSEEELGDATSAHGDITCGLEGHTWSRLSVGPRRDRPAPVACVRSNRHGAGDRMGRITGD